MSNTYSVVFLFFFVLCTLCCQFLWIVHFWLPLRYFLTFIKIKSHNVYFKNCTELDLSFIINFIWYLVLNTLPQNTHHPHYIYFQTIHSDQTAVTLCLLWNNEPELDCSPIMSTVKLQTTLNFEHFN